MGKTREEGLTACIALDPEKLLENFQFLSFTFSDIKTFFFFFLQSPAQILPLLNSFFPETLWIIFFFSLHLE